MTRTLYHGTSTANLESIKAKGLIPAYGKGAISWARVHWPAMADIEEGVTEHAVYLTTNPVIAAEFARYSAQVTDSRPVVLAVRVNEDDKLSVDERYVDRDDWRYGKALKVTHPIPISQIVQEVTP